MRLKHSGIQILKEISFLDFHLKVLFKNSCQFRKCCIIISSVDNIISIDCKIGHCYIREDFDVDILINCAIIISKNCDHCIQESIPLSSIGFCSLNSVHALKKKWTIISIESNIGVRYFKPVQIIGWWTDTESFMNGKICILKCITDI